MPNFLRTATDSLSSLTDVPSIFSPKSQSVAAFGSGFAFPATLTQTTVAGGLDAVYRITGWDATIGDEGVSHLALTLSIPPPSKPGVPSNLYLMQLLADLQDQVGALTAQQSGTGRVYSTVVVAAHNSKYDNADFVCAGFTDEQTINLAISALPTIDGIQRGRVLLLEGDYNTAAPIQVTGTFDVQIQGMGIGTRILGSDLGTIADDYHLINVVGGASDAKSRFTISDCLLQTSAASHRHGSNLAIINLNGTASGRPLYRPTIERVVMQYGQHVTTYSSFPTIQDVGYAVIATGYLYGLLVRDSMIGLQAGILPESNSTDGVLGGMLLESNGAIFSGNLFSTSTTTIDYLQGGHEVLVADNEFVAVASGTNPEMQLGASAIAFRNQGSNGQSSAINIVGNNFDVTGPFNVDSTGQHILLDSCSQVAIVGNTANDCDGAAVRIRNTVGGFSGELTSEGILIADNEFDANGWGVVIEGNASNRPIRNVVIAANSLSYENPSFSISSQEGYGVWILGNGATNNVYDVTITGNTIVDPFGGSPVQFCDPIRLEGGASYCHIYGNTIRWETDLPNWGFGVSTLTNGGSQYAIDIVDSLCTGNFVHGNDCYLLTINDAGTGTIKYGNRVGSGGLVDGLGPWIDGAGTGSATLIGASDSATGSFSVAEGFGALAYEEGQVAHASTRIAATGDAQASEVTAAGVTTSATPAALANQAGSWLVNFPDQYRTVEFEIVVVARQTVV